MGSGLRLLGKHWASRRSNTKKTKVLSDYTDLNEVGGFRKTLVLLSSPRVELIYTRGPNFEMFYPSLFFPFLFFEVAFYVGFELNVLTMELYVRLEIPIICKNFASYYFQS